MSRTCHNCPYNGKADEHCLSCAIHARGDSPMRGRVRPVPPQMLENMPDDYEDEEQYSERAALAEAKARLVAFFEAWLKIAIEEQLRRPPGIDAAICAALMVNGGDIQDAARRCEVTYWRCARARSRLMANPTIAEVLKATGGAVIKVDNDADADDGADFSQKCDFSKMKKSTKVGQGTVSSAGEGGGGNSRKSSA